MRSPHNPPLASRTYYPQNRSMLFILGCVNGLAAAMISSTVIDWVWISAGYRDRIQAFPLIGYAYQPGTALRADLEQYAPQLRGAEREPQLGK
jgi:hypothetical protein